LKNRTKGENTSRQKSKSGSRGNHGISGAHRKVPIRASALGRKRTRRAKGKTN